jgi:hypothetical protein
MKKSELVATIEAQAQEIARLNAELERLRKAAVVDDCR